VAAFRREAFDLILMDVQMPEMDGLEATAAIRAAETNTGTHIPIIAMTAHAFSEDRERCLAAGMDHVLGKPINLEVLTSTVEKYTSRDGRAVEAEPAASTPAKLTVVSSHFDAPAVSPAPAPRSMTKLVRELAGADSSDVPAPGEGPAIDLEQLETACMGLPALRSSLLHTFLADVSHRLERLTHAFDAHDARRVEFEAHGLKGMCATIGAAGCTRLFGEIEEKARDENITEARPLLQPAIDEVHRAEEFIHRFDTILARDVA